MIGGTTRSCLIKSVPAKAVPGTMSKLYANIGLLIGLVALSVVVIGCDEPAPPPLPAIQPGAEMVVAGHPFAIDAPVVLWSQPGAYNAYAERCRFTPEQVMPSEPADPGTPARYSRRVPRSRSLRRKVKADGWTLDHLRDQADLLVIHFDACGASRQCFKILHDVRGLSAHFLLDLDGTIYQTLDCKERAWHTGFVNDRSIGIEIAHIGARSDVKELDQWYAHDAEGWPYSIFPRWMGDPSILTANFVAQPARRDIISGRIHGEKLVQYDFTDQQYESLIKLIAGIIRALPGIQLQVPCDNNGKVRTNLLMRNEIDAYSGILAHWHISRGKVDPGPAFDWDRALGSVEEILADSTDLDE
jgi:N-acetylmuramoyl-L-alanine amidase